MVYCLLLANAQFGPVLSTTKQTEARYRIRQMLGQICMGSYKHKKHARLRKFVCPAIYLFNVTTAIINNIAHFETGTCPQRNAKSTNSQAAVSRLLITRLAPVCIRSVCFSGTGALISARLFVQACAPIRVIGRYSLLSNNNKLATSPANERTQWRIVRDMVASRITSAPMHLRLKRSRSFIVPTHCPSGNIVGSFDVTHKFRQANAKVYRLIGRIIAVNVFVKVQKLDGL